MTVFSGSEAVFTCEASGAEALGWNVNGTTALETNFSVTRTVGHISNITLPALSEYNSTVVQCIAGVLGGHFTWSENATLLIQGN